MLRNFANKHLTKMMLKITALPQSAAEVERIFSTVNKNKTKLRNRLAIVTLEAIIKTSKSRAVNFDINQRLRHLHSKARELYLRKYSANTIDAGTHDTFLLVKYV